MRPARAYKRVSFTESAHVESAGGSVVVIANEMFSQWHSPVEQVGGMPVYRPLPTHDTVCVGPFVLFDHFGPVPSIAAKLPAHPHAGIEVMTYLLSGANEHRDSAGNVGRVAAGGAQWMRAGRGVIHSEQTLASTSSLEGLQIWARLPLDTEDSEPEYRAVQADEVPVLERDGAIARVLAGQVKHHTGPLVTAISSVMMHISLDPDAQFPLSAIDSQEQYGAYVISGEVSIGAKESVVARRADFTVWNTPVDQLMVRNSGSARAEVFVLGGEPAPKPLVFGGPFVYDHQDKLLAAEGRFRSGAMGTLDGVPHE